MRTIQVFPQGSVADVLDDDQAVIVALKESQEPHKVQVLDFLKNLELSLDFIRQILAVQLLQQRSQLSILVV